MSNSEKYSLYDPNDAVQAIVCDIGSYATKIGFAGDDFPKSYFRSNVAVLRDSESKIQKINYDFLTRPIENESTAAWETTNPIDLSSGLLMNNNDLVQKFIQHAFDRSLLTSPSDQPLLFCERSYTPPPLRQYILQILMEELQVPAVFMARDATLACYACGRTTGTVVDIGYSGTTVTPVYEGYVELKGLLTSPVGTKELDTMLMGQLDTAAPNTHSPYLPLYQVRGHALRRHDFHTLARLAVAQDCREAGAGAAVQVDTSANSFQPPHMSFELPDGTKLDLSSKVRFGVSDLLLGSDSTSSALRHNLVQERTRQRQQEMMVDDDNDDDEEHDNTEEIAPTTPKNKSAKLALSKFGPLQRVCAPFLPTLSDSSVPAMVCESAFLCDRDQQASLLGNIVLAGGGACLGPTDQALPEFLREKMEGIIHQHTPGWRVKVLTPNYQERKVCSWIGGSILGSLGSFHDMYITKKEYDEYGPGIVNRKCP